MWLCSRQANILKELHSGSNFPLMNEVSAIRGTDQRAGVSSYKRTEHHTLPQKAGGYLTKFSIKLQP